MESSYQGYIVGPGPLLVLEAALRAIAGTRGRLVTTNDQQSFVVTDIERFARGIAETVGDGTWLWNVELRNDFENDAKGLEESHTLSVAAEIWRAGGYESRVNTEIVEEGYVRGGAMEDVAIEYVHWFVQKEEEDDRARSQRRRVGPSVPVAPQRRKHVPRGRAETLVVELIEAGKLEVVNRHAHRTLADLIDKQVEAGDAAAILGVLEDADEVVEVYADEADVAALLVAGPDSG